MFGDGKTETTMKQLPGQMRPQWIMLAVNKCIARRNEINLATEWPRFELESIKVEEVLHRTAHVFNRITANDAGKSLFGRVLCAEVVHKCPVGNYQFLGPPFNRRQHSLVDCVKFA